MQGNIGMRATGVAVNGIDMAQDNISQSQKSRNDIVFRTLLDRRSMSVREIQDLLGVSGMTVRRCLDDLQREGLIRRVHGGAKIIDPWNRGEPVFQQRLVRDAEIKGAMADRAMDLVPEGGSIYFDGGTTCYEFAKRLIAHGKRCVAVTDSIMATLELRPHKNLQTILIGGQVADDGNSMDGPLAADFASGLTVDVSFFSASGFNDEQLENSALAGVLVKKLMLQKASKVVCLIESQKYCKQKCFRFFGWDGVDVLVTDSGLPEAAREAIAAKGVEVRIVGGENAASR